MYVCYMVNYLQVSKKFNNLKLVVEIQYYDCINNRLLFNLIEVTR